MAVAKNPGVGRGRGGGRPKGKKIRDQVEQVRLRLSPRAAELLRSLAVQHQVPAWQVVERALLSTTDEGARADAPPMPPEAMEIAQECAAFLLGQENRPAALDALRRAWKQALALARHDLADADPEA